MRIATSVTGKSQESRLSIRQQTKIERTRKSKSCWQNTELCHLTHTLYPHDLWPQREKKYETRFQRSLNIKWHTLYAPSALLWSWFYSTLHTIMCMCRLYGSLLCWQSYHLILHTTFFYLIIFFLNHRGNSFFFYRKKNNHHFDILVLNCRVYYWCYESNI